MTNIHSNDLGKAVGGVAGTLIGTILTGVLMRHDVPMAQKDIKPTVDKVKEAFNQGLADKAVVAVQVKPAATSKINIISGVAIAAVVAYVGANGVPTTGEGWIALGAAVLYPLGMIVIRTWFSPSVTASSVK